MMVYRVEHAEGRFGPYVISHFVLSEAEEVLRVKAVDRLNGDQHPSPYSDNIGTMGMYEFSCFASLEQLHAWFDTASLDLLGQAGFGVFAYEVEEDLVRHGSRQSVFYRNDATRLDLVTA